jgi:putative component of toxin-antitoxin plasmid stabilization module
MDDNKVAVLIEDLMSQFRTFGDGLQQINDKMDQHILENRQEFQKITERMDHLAMENRQDHQQLNLMIRELAVDQAEIKKKRL